MAILIKHLPDKVLKLIYNKQNELKKEKKRNVSLEQTIAILLENAYFVRKKDGESKEA